VNVESSFGYNAQTTFKDFITSDRSKTDWLGFDGGLRFRDRDKDNVDFSRPSLAPTGYQEMVALGLGQYFSQQGINGWVDGSPESITYMRLGLVQLGLLQANNINSDVSYQQALAIYNQQYKPQAYSIINPNGTDYNNGFSNNWNSTYRKAPIAFTQNISVGDQVKLFGKQLGFFVGFRYGNSVRFDPNGISQRLLNEDANDLDLWDLRSIIGHKKNRLISYPCNYFHSKYPNEFIESRIVFVMFYKIKK
jgi:hypothetical protein